MTTVTPARPALDPFWFRIGGAAVAFVVAGVTASSDDGVVLCPFRRCTGGYCPGCGITRSAGHLLRGDVRASVVAHPYLLLLITQVLALVAVRAAGTAQLRALVDQRMNVVLVLNTVVVVTIWVARLANGAIPAPFSG